MFSLLSKRFTSASALVKPRKFYKEASVAVETAAAGPQFQVLLDGRKLRTTAGKIFAVESEPLAFAISQEWNSQKEHIDRTHMRLTGLAFTALDNPFEQNKESIVQSILDYLETDTILTFADQPEKLVQLQEQKWSPVIEWANEKYQMDIKPTRSLVEPAYITEQTLDRLQNFLMAQPFWTLIGLQYAVEAVKSSVLITLATASHAMEAAEGAELARLEQIFQTDTWGNVEWSHDVEHLELMSRLSSAVLFANLTSKAYSSS
uniref:ATP synthase mitochondrial F1 complex assembly factor 2 n=1 Tax=Steinernema glaseri TaxID=37863 RepID=A0A1I7ZHW1_9BILA